MLVLFSLLLTNLVVLLAYKRFPDNSSRVMLAINSGFIAVTIFSYLVN